MVLRTQSHHKIHLHQKYELHFRENITGHTPSADKDQEMWDKQKVFAMPNTLFFFLLNYL